MRRLPTVPMVLAVLVAFAACRPGSSERAEPEPQAATGGTAVTDEAEQPGRPPAFRERVSERERMVERQLAARDIDDEAVLRAMRAVPRHRFVPPDVSAKAYGDHPLPIGHDQTISQPYIVALTTQLVQPGPKKKALDIGTGSGYQAAVLAEIVDHVYSVEIVCELHDEAAARLAVLGYDNVTTRCADGYRGWPEHAPFDVITVAAAPAEIPRPLIEQLAPGGRMVIPVGKGTQELVVVDKDAEGQVRRRSVAPVRFVPMTGAAQDGK